MEGLDLLLNRVSCGRVAEPAPDSEQRQWMYKAAVRAADHKSLKPWRFLEIEGEARQALGNLFVDAARSDDPGFSEADADKLRHKPMRAPLIIVAILNYSEHPKVPEWEQRITVGCAVQNMINAAYDMGIGAYWRTGAMAEHEVVKKGLGLSVSEAIIGFIYLGKPQVPFRAVADVDPSQFVSSWNG